VFIYRFICTELLHHVVALHFPKLALSQRSRAMLRVIEYFANSLKVTQGHSK